MKKIGIFYICTGRYKVFWPSFYQSAEQYLFSDTLEYEKHYFVFTDQVASFAGDMGNNANIHPMQIANEPWPFPTLKRWHYFLSAESEWRAMDFVYFFNSNLRFIQHADTMLLPEQDKQLIFVQHPGYPDSSNPADLPYERNPESLAYIASGEGVCYLMGGLHGGMTSAYTQLCLEMQRRTDIDLERDIVAVWHDESHLNHYAIDFPQRIKILPHTTTIMEWEDGTSEKNPNGIAFIHHKSLARWGGYEWLRGQLPNQIIVKLQGGLGNQLWQYIAGLALQSLHKDKSGTAPPELLCDISRLQHSKDRKFLLKKLFPDVQVLSQKSQFAYPVYKEPKDFTFDNSFLDLPPAIYLEGYFQHYRYFEMAMKALKPQLLPLAQLYQECQIKYRLVALHVRRGDYVQLVHEAGINLVPLLYYRKALQEIAAQVSQPLILLFSDDQAYLESQIVPECQNLGLAYQLVRHADPRSADLQDFSLMAQCDHFIIANSSFSAAAAMLGTNDCGTQHKESLVFMPQVWHYPRNVLSSQFLPSHWQSLTYSYCEGPKLKAPAVSIIIPVYNTQEYLVRCLDSVCLQTEPNIEIIIVDDASPDNSWELIQAYASRDSRIIPIRHEKNKHLGGARNTGIDTARGEWLLFLDSDDYILCDTVEVFLEAARRHPMVPLIMCRIMQVKKSGQCIPFDNNNPNYESLIEEPFREYCLSNSIFHCAWAKLWSKKLWSESSIRFPEHMAMEDLAAVPRLLALVDKAVAVPDRLFFYQQRETSICGSYSAAKMEDLGKAMAILEKWRSCDLSLPKSQMLQFKMIDVLNVEAKGICYSNDFVSDGVDFSGVFIQLLENPKVCQRLQHLAEHTVPFLGLSWLYNLEKQMYVENNLWYRFGQSSRKRKIWIIGEYISKKLHIYRLLQPLARILVRVFRYILAK